MRESYKTYMGSLALTAPDSWGFLSGSTLYGGIVNGFGRLVRGNSADSDQLLRGGDSGHASDRPAMGASFDYLDIQQILQRLLFRSPAICRFRRPRSSASMLARNTSRTRTEFCSQDLNPGGAYKAEVLALTGTIQYDLWKNVISRVEVRWDHSLLDNALFGGNGNAELRRPRTTPC